MNKYEAMFIVKPDLSDEDKKTLFSFMGEAVTKHGGMISNSGVWAERRKLYFPIKKQGEGVYYLLSFTLDPKAVKDITHAYGLNENILRVLVSNLE